MKKILALAAVSLLSSVWSTPASAETSRRYAGVKAFLQRLATENPERATLFPLGESDSKETIVGLKVGHGPVRNLVVAAHHGNEYGSTEVALAFAESIAKQPIEGQTVFVVPVLNIGGYEKRNREERTASGSSQDPNRDYPGPCGTDGPFRLKSTAALAQFVAREGIVSSATLHTYYPAVVYPWGLSSRDLATAYPEIFGQMVRTATEDSHYEIGNSTEVIYPADGTFEDYAFWKHGVWSILFELGYSHSPSENDIQNMIRVNVPGIRKMFERAPTQLAQSHAFTGKCDLRLKSLDRRDE